MAKAEKMFALHVVPLEDAVAHHTDDCVCGPSVTFRDDGRDTFRFQHHRLEDRAGGWAYLRVVQQDLPELDRQRESDAG
ncbi:hypothetical protein [Rhodococcus sp. X156]|uniref:hypothetical protein n=1 Tax=Rhodococcus sp. X156 TaxID=2499145 RepID=UPI000FD8DA57|nr:hypothetical protein [Rhodococcus sp. X156]